MEYFFYIIIGLIVLLLAFFVLGGVLYIVDEWIWFKTPEFTHESTLLGQNYRSSTLQTNTVPVITGGGVGVGVTTSGEDEKYVTTWDCGEYGRLVSRDKQVFRFAKEKSVLLLKKRQEDVRIVGIEID